MIQWLTNRFEMTNLEYLLHALALLLIGAVFGAVATMIAEWFKRKFGDL